jgi:hypothetical protein
MPSWPPTANDPTWTGVNIRERDIPWLGVILFHWHIPKNVGIRVPSKSRLLDFKSKLQIPSSHGNFKTILLILIPLVILISPVDIKPTTRNLKFNSPNFIPVNDFQSTSMILKSQSRNLEINHPNFIPVVAFSPLL